MVVESAEFKRWLIYFTVHTNVILFASEYLGIDVLFVLQMYIPKVLGSVATSAKHGKLFVAFI